VGSRTIATSLQAVRPYNSFIMTRLTDHRGRHIDYASSVVAPAHDQATRLPPIKDLLEMAPTVPWPPRLRKRRRIGVETGGYMAGAWMDYSSGASVLQLCVFARSFSLA
jgi:hypothetical protein